MDIKAELSALSDEEYRKFHSRLLPGTEHILGVRVPELRKLAKRLVRDIFQKSNIGNPSMR